MAGVTDLPLHLPLLVLVQGVPVPRVRGARDICLRAPEMSIFAVGKVEQLLILMKGIQVLQKDEFAPLDLLHHSGNDQDLYVMTGLPRTSQ